MRPEGRKLMTRIDDALFGLDCLEPWVMLDRQGSSSRWPAAQLWA
jgi:hypothetical protein